MRRLLLLATIALLTACSGTGSDGAPGSGAPGNGEPPGGGIPAGVDLRITGITIRGGLAQGAAVAVRGIPDQDGIADARYGVAFVLGGNGPTALPADDGTAWNAEFPVTHVGGDQQSLDAVTVSVER